MQRNLYSNLLFAAKSEVKASLSALANITALKKLCNHPDLVYEKIMERADGFENAAKLMPSNYNTKLVRSFRILLGNFLTFCFSFYAENFDLNSAAN